MLLPYLMMDAGKKAAKEEEGFRKVISYENRAFKIR